MKTQNYLDSTYLKTPEQSGLSEVETLKIVQDLAQEAIDNQFFAVMIRPNLVKEIKSFLNQTENKVVLGTVIGFHEGTYSVTEKLAEAEKAIADGADELDFVINYEAYKKGETDLVKKEVLECTKLCLENGKIAKWIIEIAALTDEQIVGLTVLIREVVEGNFEEKDWGKVFVKSSTGFYKTEDGKPNGATFEGIQLMLDNAGKLPVKAAGGVRTPEDAEKMIKLGVQRIGTSSAKALVGKGTAGSGY